MHAPSMTVQPKGKPVVRPSLFLGAAASYLPSRTTTPGPPLSAWRARANAAHRTDSLRGVGNAKGAWPPSGKGGGEGGTVVLAVGEVGREALAVDVEPLPAQRRARGRGQPRHGRARRARRGRQRARRGQQRPGPARAAPAPHSGGFRGRSAAARSSAARLYILPAALKYNRLLRSASISRRRKR